MFPRSQTCIRRPHTTPASKKEQSILNKESTLDSNHNNYSNVQEDHLETLPALLPTFPPAKRQNTQLQRPKTQHGSIQTSEILQRVHSTAPIYKLSALKKTYFPTLATKIESVPSSSIAFEKQQRQTKNCANKSNPHSNLSLRLLDSQNYIHPSSVHLVNLSHVGEMQKARLNQLLLHQEEDMMTKRHEKNKREKISIVCRQKILVDAATGWNG
ncbi:hypothetical protein HK098_000294 [Nowakowskiella sp. JEL0407]|nr:hypothetical protein HK098_000294 [Nowakowskiella sp. JEL0407]